jgi:hypothetical protein
MPTSKHDTFRVTIKSRGNKAEYLGGLYRAGVLERVIEVGVRGHIAVNYRENDEEDHPTRTSRMPTRLSTDNTENRFDIGDDDANR